MFVKKAKAKLIKNSRKEDSIEVRIKTSCGEFFCSAPSGKSKGANEVEDYNQKGARFSSKLANLFLKRINSKKLNLRSFEEIRIIEEELKKFEKQHGLLGGNVFYAIEGALLKAAAKEKNQELWEFLLEGKTPKIPSLVGNCIGGGLHTRTRSKKPDFQEFLFISLDKPFSKAVSKTILAYYDVRMKLRWKEKKLMMRTNDENAHICSQTNQEALELMSVVAKKFNLEIGLDIAASSFYDKNGMYDYKNKRFLRDKEEQLEYISNLIEEFNLFYVEDPFQEDDFVGFRKLVDYVKKKGKQTLIVGDDLTVTNLERLKRAQKAGAINAVVIKPNQIGSMIEVKKAVDFCKQHGIKTIFSHRSGETLDTLIADYAVGFQADFIKTGILGRERLIKLKRIINIQKRINS